jgi:DNA adenine methylase
LLRYYGGKWQIAPWIISHFPKHQIYVEAYGGGGSVLLRKDRSYGEIYNDLDKEVVNVFRVLQKNSRKLQRLLEVTPFSRDEMELAYTRVQDPVERARRAIVRSFMGFGADSVTRSVRTGFRANSNRSGTTPAHDWATWPKNIQLFHERLTGVVIENRDALEVMESQDSPGTLHFLDPPYVHSTRGSMQAGHGYAHEMSNAEHEKLCDFIKGLKGMVILCGYQNQIYERLGWKTVSTETKVLGNKPRTEVLWLNPAASTRMQQPSLFSRGEGNA